MTTSSGSSEPEVKRLRGKSCSVKEKGFYFWCYLWLFHSNFKLIKLSRILISIAGLGVFNFLPYRIVDLTGKNYRDEILRSLIIYNRFSPGLRRRLRSVQSFLDASGWSCRRRFERRRRRWSFRRSDRGRWSRARSQHWSGFRSSKSKKEFPPDIEPKVGRKSVKQLKRFMCANDKLPKKNMNSIS
jgi:hypothetical protein